MKKIIFSITILITIILINLSFYIVTEKDYVILTEFGKPIGKPIQKAGLYFKTPIQTANKINKQLNIFTTQPIQLLLKDQNPVIITCYICWKINKPFKFFQAISSTEIATQKISDIINDKLGATLGNYLISNIINTNKNEVKLNEIENKLKMLVDKSTSENYGINVLDVGIKRINYPQIVAETVYNRMQAEREKEAKKYRAEGMEKASIIESNTDKFIAEIISEANKKAEIIKGEGDKKAIEIYSNAYSKEPDFFEFLKSLEVYGSVLNEKSTLILSTESDIFKYLNKTEK